MGRSRRHPRLLSLAAALTGILTMTVTGCTTARPASSPGTAADLTGSWELTAGPPGFPPIAVHGVSGAGDLRNAEVVVVMHGTERNAAEYRDSWVPLVRGRPVVVVVPEFTDEDFPGSAGYNLGGVTGPDGEPVPRERWTFAAIEPIVAEVRHRLGNTGATFAMFGHSAGAQFVHRYLELVPDAPVTTAVAANAGWYTMPDRSAVFPYGLRRLPGVEVDVAALFARDLVVLLGTDDLETENLRRDSGANAQGATRYERGLAFHARGRAAAAAAGVPFRWRLVVVPGVAHDHVAMAAAAVDLVAPPAR